MYMWCHMPEENQPLGNLQTFFATRKVATLGELMDHIERSRATVFRLLGRLDYITSYDRRHSGITLASIPEFDAWGLWKSKGFHFSRWDTLNETIQNVVNMSPAGLHPKELRDLLEVRVHNHLSMCVADNRVFRDDAFGHPAYFSMNAGRRREQLQQREGTSPRRPSRERPPLSNKNIIMVLVCILKHHKTSVEELMPLLEADGLHISERSVRWVLQEYEIEKKGSP